MSSSVDHYENFPVASWLCPKPIRPAVRAIYHWARTGDDIADEGSAAPAERLADLASMRLALSQALKTDTPDTPDTADTTPPPDSDLQRWSGLVQPLAHLVALGLDPQPLFDLLTAFEADVQRTAPVTAAPTPRPLGHRYADWPELLQYCSHSANPIGRLMLQLYKVSDPQVVAHSDAVCTALQLINFWQDLSQDLARGRYYIPVSVLAQHHLPPHCDLRALPQAQSCAVVASLVQHARALMAQGTPVIHAVPGLAGWELAGVVAGGLRVLHRIEHTGYRAAHIRPKLGKLDWLAVAWHAVRLKLSRPNLRQ
ncbi:MAG: squalene synthase HpnC [Burkholderiaceae bacterium]|nr:squalene synthase HpnC [Burkholderiaceae bacterium]